MPNTTKKNPVKIENDNEVSNFNDLFVNPENIESFVEILKEETQKINKPVLDSERKWIGKRGSFSILIAWWDALQENSKFKKSDLKARNKSILLNDYFEGLKMKEEGSLWNDYTNPYSQMKPIFMDRIKAMK